MRIYRVVKEEVESLLTERNKHVLKQDSNNDSDGESLTSFGIEFQREKEFKKRRAITKCGLTLCRSVEKRHGLCAAASVAGV